MSVIRMEKAFWNVDTTRLFIDVLSVNQIARTTVTIDSVLGAYDLDSFFHVYETFNQPVFTEDHVVIGEIEVWFGGLFVSSLISKCYTPKISHDQLAIGELFNDTDSISIVIFSEKVESIRFRSCVFDVLNNTSETIVPPQSWY